MGRREKLHTGYGDEDFDGSVGPADSCTRTLGCNLALLATISQYSVENTLGCSEDIR